MTILTSVRDFSENDIPDILNYWFHSPPGYLESMGVDRLKMPSEETMKKSLSELLSSGRKLHALTIVHDNEAVGFHVLNPLKEGEFGIFHAHLWKRELRGKGIGFHSYPQACRVFAERFDLKRILFKTPIQNTGALRVKEKLGIRCIGEESIGFGILKDATPAKVFEWTREELIASL